MKRRILSILLTVSMLLSLCPFAASAQDTFDQSEPAVADEEINSDSASISETLLASPIVDIPESSSAVSVADEPVEPSDSIQNKNDAEADAVISEQLTPVPPLEIVDETIDYDTAYFIQGGETITLEAGTFEYLYLSVSGINTQNVQFDIFPSTGSDIVLIMPSSMTENESGELVPHFFQVYGLSKGTRFVSVVDTTTGTTIVSFSVEVTQPQIEVTSCIGNTISFSFCGFNPTLLSSSFCDGAIFTYSETELGTWGDQSDIMNSSKWITRYQYDCSVTVPTAGTYTAILYNTNSSGYTNWTGSLNLFINDHESDSLIVPPTCSESGLITEYCVNCGNTLSTSIGDPPTGNHTWSDEYKIDTNATCVSSGSMSFHCSHCNAINEESAVLLPPTGIHDWAPEYTIDLTATCVSNGYKSRHCNNCSATTDNTMYSDSIHERTELRNMIEPTYLDSGYTGDTYCIACNTLLSYGTDIPRLSGTPFQNITIYRTNALIANKTIYGDVYIAPTAVVQFINVKITGSLYVLGGCYLEESTCSKVYCNRMTVSSNPSTSTSWTYGEVRATKTPANNNCIGSIVDQIPIYIDEVISINGRLQIAGSTINVVTMTIYGNSVAINDDGTFYADIQHDSQYNAVPILLHSVSGEIGIKLISVPTYYRDPLGHDMTIIKPTQPTCTTAGNDTYYFCSECSLYYGADYSTITSVDEQTRIALGHSQSTDLMSDDTNHWYTCTRCNEQLDTAQHINTTTTIQPTPTQTGLITDTCTICGHTETIVIPKIVLSAPANLSVTNTSKGVQVKWDSVDGAEQYRVYRKTNSTDSWAKLVDTTATSIIDTDVTSGTAYYYTVKPIAPTSGKYDTTGVRTIYLSASTVSAANVSTGVAVSWTKVAGASGYYLYRSTDGTNYTRIATTTGDTLTFTDTGRTNGKELKYKVFAYRTSGSKTFKSPSSKVKTYYWMKAPAISAVTNSAAGKATVEWSQNKSCTGYQVQYVTGTTTKTVTVTGKTTLTTVLSKLTKGSTYKVSVRAYRTVDGKNYYSAWSAAKTVKIVK